MKTNRASSELIRLPVEAPDRVHAVSIEFGSASDEKSLSRWRSPFNDAGGQSARDALEYARLAGKRWRYYSDRGEVASSIDDLHRRILGQPKAEIGFLIVARPTWTSSPRILAMAWCRRTWCHHLIVDFLATHPAAASRGYRGLGSSMLLSLAEAARRLAIPLIWGEATDLSASFYEKILVGQRVQDHFFINGAALNRLQKQASASASFISLI